MPLPKWLARANRVGLNRVTRFIAPWMPGFGILIHKGRKSGKEFRTPINLFRRGEGFVFALTYGTDVDWLKNVKAAGSCEIVTRRRSYKLVDPELFHDEARSEMPFVPRQILAVAKVYDFVRMRIE